MRIVLLGSDGQVGWEARRSLAPLGEVIALSAPQIDLARPQELVEQVMALRPQVIYNAAAYTNVDQAEREPEQARLVNSEAPAALAEAAARHGAVLVHFSTDYVFDGSKGSDYLEGDATSPLNVYGQTKLAGEQGVRAAGGAHFILRTAWVYSLRRASFVSRVLQWSRGQASIRVASDQISNPTWARALAEVTALLLAKGGADLFDWASERRGVYHLAGGGSASRLEWAQAILGQRPAGSPPVEVIPARSDEFPAPAARPLYSALNCDLFARVFGLRLPPWQQALALAMEELGGAGVNLA